jgi:hypothetical protein
MAFLPANHGKWVFFGRGSSGGHMVVPVAKRKAAEQEQPDADDDEQTVGPGEPGSDDPSHSGIAKPAAQIKRAGKPDKKEKQLHIGPGHIDVEMHDRSPLCSLYKVTIMPRRFGEAFAQFSIIGGKFIGKYPIRGLHGPGR